MLIHAEVARFVVGTHRANVLRLEKQKVSKAIHKEIAQGNSKASFTDSLSTPIERWLRQKGYAVRNYGDSAEVFW